MITPSAPLLKARITMSEETLAVHITRTGLMLVGYCARIVPAISQAPYPHFQHKNAIILGSKFCSVMFMFLLQLMRLPIFHRLGRSIVRLDSI